MIKEDELSNTLETLGKKPKLVITDSQVFARVSEETPEDIWLTSFSILFARFKGNLKTAAAGAAALDRLKDGDKILISEGCTTTGSVMISEQLSFHAGSVIIRGKSWNLSIPPEEISRRM